MMEIKGKYNTAKVFTDYIEDEAISQLIQLLNQDFLEGAKVRIMPDCHAGAGCVIGFTADIGEKVIPNLVGVDIGCGMLTVKLGQVDMDLAKLDDVIRNNIPAGFNYHKEKVVDFDDIQNLKCYKELKDIERIEKSIGTLGGGNHFIEVDIDSNGNKYLVIHSGSRNLGQQVAKYYQKIAIELQRGKDDYIAKKHEIIETYKSQGKQKEIPEALIELKKEYDRLQPKYPKELCFLTGRYRKEYLHDMEICQEYAILNRETMANILLKKIFNKSLDKFEHFHTIHNYINFKDNIMRKGAISAYEGEKVLIPINMRDGAILGIGKGNSDWNYSAPHGAGRLMSRSKAKENISLEEFQKSMAGIYTTSVNESTLDESPMAYKPIESILANIGETVEVIEVIKPIYNFKA